MINKTKQKYRPEMQGEIQNENKNEKEEKAKLETVAC
jgi:hypothetical protein